MSASATTMLRSYSKNSLDLGVDLKAQNETLMTCSEGTQTKIRVAVSAVARHET